MSLAEGPDPHWDMAPSEKVGLGRALEELEKPKADERVGGRPPKTAENVPAVSREEGRVRHIVGQAVGMSGPTYQRAKAVVEAAENGQPGGHLV